MCAPSIGRTSSQEQTWVAVCDGIASGVCVCKAGRGSLPLRPDDWLDFCRFHGTR
jgi:hypothetical protein